jgi:regulation of enolase protein 1 (concanavalin A-like superfamily)
MGDLVIKVIIIRTNRRTDFITPDYIGFYSDRGTAAAPIISNLFYWLEE